MMDGKKKFPKIFFNQEEDSMEESSIMCSVESSVASQSLASDLPVKKQQPIKNYTKYIKHDQMSKQGSSLNAI